MTSVLLDNGYTPQQQQEYIQHGGNECPVCHSDNISAEPSVFSDENLIVPVHCLDCRENWTELYTLVNIEPAND